MAGGGLNLNESVRCVRIIAPSPYTISSSSSSKRVVTHFTSVPSRDFEQVWWVLVVVVWVATLNGAIGVRADNNCTVPVW